MENSDATILVFDENANDLITLNLLTQKAFPFSVVQIARNQESGFEIASSGTIDVILLDIGTDEMKGIELFRKLKSEIKTLDIPVVLISSIEERDLCSFYPRRKPPVRR